MKHTGPTDENVRKIILELRKSKKELHTEVADYLSKPRRRKMEVNLNKLEKESQKNENIVVPTKVLGTGSIEKPVKVYAYKFSKTAEDKIKKAGGSCHGLDELLKTNVEARMII